MAKMNDVFSMGKLERCSKLAQGQVKELEQPMTQEDEQDKDTFTIYQLKVSDEMRDFLFKPYDCLQKAGLVIDPVNYVNIYTAPLESEMGLEDIFIHFNIDHPKDFKGRSLSISDVVVLHQNGQDTAYYVDSIGYQQVPEFLREQ